MKIFGRYLSYRLKQSLLRTVVFVVIALIITHLTVMLNLAPDPKYFDTGLYMQSTIMGILATIIPILECAGLKSRRNLDTLYSFAINRKSMALVHYLSGWIQLISIYTISFWYHIFLIANQIDMTYVFLFYLLSLLSGFFMYNIFMYLYQKANSIVDGIVYCIAGMFLLSLCLEAGRQIAKSLYVSINHQYMPSDIRMKMVDSAWGIIYIPINNLTVDFENLINPNRRIYGEASFDRYFRASANYWIGWILLGIVCLWGYVRSFVYKGAQRIGDISDSLIGYKLFIPAYAYLGLFLLGSSDYWTFVLCMTAFYLAYVVFRRSFKVNNKDLLMMAFGIIPLLLRSYLDIIGRI